jgi:cytochrome b561
MSRYSGVAIALHWLMALAIIGLIMVGFWMGDAAKDPETRAAAFAAFQLHKSMGLTILLLTLLRLAWRLSHRPPPLPSTMKSWERGAARFTHIGFYVLMIAVPLSGWAMVSASPLGLPTYWFGLFEWPHIGPLAALENKEALKHDFYEAHELLAKLVIGLLLLHVAAALKHHFIDRDDVLSRMLPLLKVRS